MEPVIVPAVSYKKYIAAGGSLLLITAGGVYTYQSYFMEKTVVEKHQEVQVTASTGASVVATTITTTTASSYKHNDSISDEERSLVVESKVNMFEILSSKDIIKIRAYLDEGIKASGNEKQLSDISNLSDKNLLSMVNMILSFGFPGIENSQDLINILISDKTVWTKDTKDGFEHVNMVIDIDDTDEHTTLEAFKFGNVWY
jgi:hypothetical protein